MQVTKHLALTSPGSSQGSSPVQGRDRGMGAGDAETGVPPVKCRRVIVNRGRQLELVEGDLPEPGPGKVRLKTLAAGVSHRGERLRPSKVLLRKASGRESHLIVELTEGKNREIRRLFDAIGHEVTALKRVRFAEVELGTLAPGAWRTIDEDRIWG